MLLPHNPTLECDVLLAFASGDFNTVFDAIDTQDFYDLRHRYLFDALRLLRGHARLRRVVEVRVGGRRLENIEDAFGKPSTWVGFVVPGLAEALLELGAPHIGALVRYFEGLFFTHVPAFPGALDRLRAMAEDRRRLFELDAERNTISERWAS